jgi:hypothetical protein
MLFKKGSLNKMKERNDINLNIKKIREKTKKINLKKITKK